MATRTPTLRIHIRHIGRRLRARVPALGLGAAICLLLFSLTGIEWDIRVPYGSTEALGPHLAKLLSIAIAPGVALGLYIYCRDRYYNNSLKLLVKLFLYGALSGPIAGLVEHIAESVLKYRNDTASVAEHFFFFFFVVGLLEELAKFTVAWKFTYRSREFKQVYDGVLFCTAAALGFATLENIFYVLTAGYGAMDVALGRALTSVPSHVADAVVMGYAMGRARAVKGRPKEQEWLILGLGGAVLLHGAYDFVLQLESMRVYLFFPTMIGGWVAAYCMLRKGIAYSPFIRCTRCNRVIPQLASYCPFCQRKRKVLLTCWSCGAELTKWSRRCTSCYTRVRFPWHLRVEHLTNLFPGRRFVACPSCEEEVPAGTAYCLHCGYSRRMHSASLAATRRAKAQQP